MPASGSQTATTIAPSFVMASLAPMPPSEAESARMTADPGQMLLVIRKSQLLARIPL